jgi:hypothetical protein
LLYYVVLGGDEIMYVVEVALNVFGKGVGSAHQAADA